MVTYPAPICYKCEHLSDNLTQISDGGTLFCRAFPKGIPRKYFFFDEEEVGKRPEHREVDPDQVGEFVFTPKDEQEGGC